MKDSASNAQDNAADIISNLSDDALVVILSYLSPPEIARFKFVSGRFNNLVDKSLGIDVLLQPQLNRLKAIDPTLSLLKPLHNDQRPWRFRLFKEKFAEIANKQWDEIQHFKKLADKKEIEIDEKLLAKLKDFSSHATQLSMLEERDGFLNDLNAKLIEKKINVNLQYLEITSAGLTRFPKQLFENPTYAAYWGALRRLICCNNKFEFLPDLIGNCVSLESLDCSNNQFKLLPNSISNCVSLKVLVCGYNKLESLPSSIGHCRDLQKLHCNNNQLQSLPYSIANCRALQDLSCHDNQLESLPDSFANWAMLNTLYCENNELQFLPASIDNCMALKNIDCEKNQLQSLSNALIAKFGEEWATNTLAKQKILFIKDVLSQALNSAIYLPSQKPPPVHSATTASTEKRESKYNRAKL